MERVFKWTLPLLLVAQVVLVWSGWVDLRMAVGVAVAVEVLLVLVVVRQVVVVVRRYRRNRAEGLDLERAIEESLSAVLPGRVARLVALEPTLWVCIGQWITGRRPDDAHSFSYRKRSSTGAVLVLVVLTAPAEILLIELLVPWFWLRLLLLIGSIYSLVWLVGLYASLIVRPHRLESSGIRIRYGVLADVRIPCDQVEGVERLRRQVSGGDGLTLVPDDDAACLVVGGRTDVVLRLRSGHAFSRLLGPAPTVTTIYVAVDEPERFVEAVGAFLAGRSDLSADGVEPALAQRAV